MGKSKELFNKEREEEFLSDLHEPKSQLKSFDLFIEIQRMIDRVKEGYENELEIYCLFSDAEKAFASARNEILPSAINEREKYDEKTVELFGHKISFAQSGRYDYSNNPKWVAKKTEMETIQDLMKAALKSAEKGVTMVDENGEVIPMATYTPSKLSLKLG